MWSFVWFQTAVGGVDLRAGIEIATIVFFGGAGWQQLRDLNRRVGRIETKLFNGDKH